MNALLLLLLSLQTQPTQAGIPSGLSSQALLTITSDTEKGATQFSALVDEEGHLAGFYSKTNKGSSDVYWLKDVEKKGGVSILEYKGYEVIRLQGKLSRDTQEGSLNANYLASALFGTRKSCLFKLLRNGKGWFVQSSATGKAVNKVVVEAHDTGIKALRGLCAGGK